jgi:alkaline phosphatase
VGVTAEVREGDCAGQKVAAHQASSLLAWAQAAGRATGLVTTDRCRVVAGSGALPCSLTGASPAGVFAHSANRDWENDTAGALSSLLDLRPQVTPPECEDIASQLVTGRVGRGLRVVLGGGAGHFRSRRDGRDLAAEWLAGRGAEEAVFVGTGEELAAVNNSNTDFLLGLFAEDEMDYALGRAEGSEQPSLAEMTAKAIEVLEQHEEGFVLFVEGALVDKAHHKGMARRALAEVLELEAAVEAALERTDPAETLTIVTADHSHGFTISGYPDRGEAGVAQALSPHQERIFSARTQATPRPTRA